MFEILQLQPLAIAQLAVVGLAVVVLVHYPSVSLGLLTFSYVIRGGLLLPGLNLSGVFLLTTILGVLAYVHSGRRLNFRFTKWDLWVVLLSLVVVMGSTYGPDTEYGQEKALRFVMLVAVPYFLARVIIVEPAQFRRFAVTVLASSVVLAVLLLAIYWFPMVVPSDLRAGAEEGGEGRFWFLEANPVPVGTMLMVGAALVLGTVRGRGVASLGVSAALLALLLFALFLTGTRGAAIGLLVIFVLAGIATFVRSPRRATFIALAVLAAALILPTWSDRFPNWQRFAALTRVSELTTDQAVVGRLELHGEAWSMFVENTALGGGTGAMSFYPHNIFYEVAAENGLIGLVPLVLLLGLIFGRARAYLLSQRRMSPEQAAIVFAIVLPLIGILITRQFSFGLAMHKDLFIFLALAVNLPYILSRVAEQDPGLSEGHEAGERVLAGQPSRA